MNKPIISYWKSGDPCLYISTWINKLTEINVFDTKHLTDEFIQICLDNKHRMYLHVNITGMGQTQFEPNIPTVKDTFFQLKKLINLGFPQKQILLCVNPILPNENGLNALRLLLRIFTEHKDLKFRNIRFNVLRYKSIEDSDRNWSIANDNIAKRKSLYAVKMYLSNQKSFWYDYFKLIEQYQAIISVDKGEGYLIGIRELTAFNLKNEWIDENGNKSKLITYEKNNRFKPIVNIISNKNPVRCKNRCLLCPHRN